MKYDYAFQKSHKDEDQKKDPSYGQLTYNVGILESALELEKLNVRFLE